jgi:hypothetical protein
MRPHIINAVSPFLSHAGEVRSIQYFKNQSEACFQFVFPLKQYGGRTDHDDVADFPTE